MPETFYDVLGVGPDATTEEIDDAYRDRIKETHPDVSDEEDAEEQAKRVIEAKEVLTDDDERARYDRLGHDAYVRQTTVDADWGGGPDPASAAETTTGTGTGAGTGPGTGATWSETEYDGETTWAGRDERRRGRSDPDRAGGDGDTASGRTGDAGGATGSPSGTGTASTASSDAAGGGERRRTTARNVGEAVGWASGIDGRHAVRNGEEHERIPRKGLFPPDDSPVLMIAMFVCYPSLVFTSLFPAFPIVVNLAVGICTLIIVAYLMSMPEVGVYVFGAWSVLATLITLASGFSAFSLLGVVVLGSTWVPLGLTLAVYQVMRW